MLLRDVKEGHLIPRSRRTGFRSQTDNALDLAGGAVTRLQSEDFDEGYVTASALPKQRQKLLPIFRHHPSDKWFAQQQGGRNPEQPGGRLVDLENAAAGIKSGISDRGEFVQIRIPLARLFQLGLHFAQLIVLPLEQDEIFALLIQKR
jgi:hypothetical protein